MLELYLQQLKDWVMYCYFGEKLKTLLVLYSTKMNYWTKLLIHHWCKYLLSFLVVGVYQFFLINCASVLWNNTALMESCFNEWCRQWFPGFFKEFGEKLLHPMVEKCALYLMANSTYVQNYFCKVQLILCQDAICDHLRLAALVHLYVLF